MKKERKTGKVNFEQFEQECLEKGLILLEKTYKGPHEKHKCLNEEGYIVMVIKNQTIRCNRKTMIFATSNQYTLENLEKWLLENNSKFELIKGQTYTKNSILLEFKCNVCGEIIKQSLANITRGKGCGSCNGTQVTPFNSLETHRPDLIKYLVDKTDAKKFAKMSHQKIKCKCEKCGKEKQVIIKNLVKQGFSCDECDGISLNFSFKNARLYKKEWEIKPAFVYFIKCWSEKEEFYKIGITTQKTIKRRFHNKKDMPYEWKEIKKIPTNLYNAIFMEKKLHEKHEKFKYSPEIEFGGHTECFTKLID